MVTVTGVTEAGNYRRDFPVAWEVPESTSTDSFRKDTTPCMW